MRKRLGRRISGEALDPHEQHRIDHEDRAEEQLAGRGVVRPQVVGPSEHQEAGDQCTHDDAEQGDLALHRRSLGVDDPSPVGLMTGLLGQGVQHGHRAGAALDGDQQPGGDQVAEWIVDLVGEPPEHDVGILPTETGGEPADLRPDRRSARGDGGVDRTDRLIAGDQHVTQVLDPRGEGIGALDDGVGPAVAPLPRPDRGPGGHSDHECGRRPPREGEHDDPCDQAAPDPHRRTRPDLPRSRIGAWHRCTTCGGEEEDRGDTGERREDEHDDRQAHPCLPWTANCSAE